MAKKKKIDLNAAPENVVWRPSLIEAETQSANDDEEPWRTISMLTRAGFHVSFLWASGAAFDPSRRASVVCTVYPVAGTNKLSKYGTGSWISSGPRSSSEEAWKEALKEIGKLDSSPAERRSVGNGKASNAAVSGISN